ncbi:ABC transporter ATP-binding protein [Lactobacillus delbrueckii subsp. lactis]|jgi:putative ABC transport system ATP-binding protein|uniref:ABC transporter ATP-binding protein n=2 Tax=Lactobacillus delbrueckii TaxID=1584 RepID=UPI0001EC3278|nr:ABC transporter ATP-binding protein [Lactobacillus delbrueckii]ADQ61059.1 ABC-type antimicrobial peptide transport system, ATPase component [Lactobacillus delbrueckii subsp. bulgaricus ND02]MBO3081982.1 ABC transporter ATP-binding protein [Lactobacillus delbrueckii subsp. bulgaricus]MCD5438431.1 ABC transporter ATP-binding protein [Lactobacillus delbrueckii subsp. lactis]MCD5469019.1 ABC transporter ATP-binding protein [Lactobacillus delbrueckii subsp. lactis]MCZ0796494.1 ABC transporter AT
MEKVMTVNNVTKTYGKKGEKQFQALKGVSLSIAKGEFVAIMGTSGSGKTTLLNIMSTLDKPSSGEVTVNGKNIAKLKKNQMAAFRAKEIGFIFQDFNLLDNLTARENIALPLSLQGVKSSEIDSKVDKIAAKLNISEVLEKYPAAISGGQKQRVAAARALVHEPAILMADEPTGALDSKSSRALLDTMELLNEKDRVSILMVTHDPLSASFADRILFIRDGLIDEEIKRGDLKRQDFCKKLISQLSENTD